MVSFAATRGQRSQGNVWRLTEAYVALGSGSGSGVSPSWEVVERGPVVEAGPLVMEAAVSIRGEVVVVVVAAGFV